MNEKYVAVKSFKMGGTEYPIGTEVMFFAGWPYINGYVIDVSYKQTLLKLVETDAFVKKGIIKNKV